MTATIQVDVTRVLRRFSEAQLFVVTAFAAAQCLTARRAVGSSESVPSPGLQPFAVGLDMDGPTTFVAFQNATLLNMSGFAGALEALIAERQTPRGPAHGPLERGTFAVIDATSHGTMTESHAAAGLTVLTVASVNQQPVIVTDAAGSHGFAVRSVVHLSLACDSDAPVDATFLRRLKRLLEDQAWLDAQGMLR